MRSDWTTLPETVTTGIADRLGGAIDAVTPASVGDHAEVAATVAGPGTTVFVKAAFAGIQSLRFELAATKAIAGIPYPPKVQWHFEADGWLVVGTECLRGPHPDLSPGSRDLELFAAALGELQKTPAPSGNWFSPAARCGFEIPAMEGDILVHSDLNPTNLIVTPDGLRVVDWAFTTRAAPWVELALLTQWLIGSGHTAVQAEEWLAQCPAWGAADPEVLDDFASRNASKWSLKARQSNETWVHDLAVWTVQWSAYRRRGTRRPI